MQTAFLYLGAFGLALTLPVLAAAWLYRQDSHPLLDAASRLRRLPRIVQLALLAFVAQLIVYGSQRRRRLALRLFGGQRHVPRIRGTHRQSAGGRAGLRLDVHHRHP